MVWQETDKKHKYQSNGHKSNLRLNTTNVTQVTEHVHVSMFFNTELIIDM
jgi:hypothetical protein